MRPRVALSLLAVLAMAGCDGRPKPPRDCQRCVEFEAPLALGTKYGAPAGNHPGDVVFTESGIQVSVDSFKFTGEVEPSMSRP
jgi:hypothetical protein